MRGSILTIALGTSLAALLACSDFSDTQGSFVYTIVPGKGLMGPEGSIQLGDTADSLKLAAGAPDIMRVMGDGTVHFTYSGIFVTGILSGSGGADVIRVIYVGPGFEGRTDSGVGIGTEREAVTESFGAALVEPFLGTWIYPGHGVGFQWEEDDVARISVF